MDEAVFPRCINCKYFSYLSWLAQYGECTNSEFKKRVKDKEIIGKTICCAAFGISDDFGCIFFEKK